MIDAYLDESGIHSGAKVCLIAGYIGGPGQMKRLDHAWRKTLADFQFPMRDFHAKDLLKSRDAQPMLTALAKVAGEQGKIHPVAYGVVVNDFNGFCHDERRFLTGATLMQSGKLVTSGCPSKPYFAPFQGIIRLATDRTHGGRTHFYFGLGKPISDYAMALFAQMKKDADTPKAINTWKSRDRLGDPAFPSAEVTAPLQAADLLVHCVYQHMLERVMAGETGNFTKLPTGLARIALANAMPSDLIYQDRECLQNMINQAKALCPAWKPA